MNFGEKVQLLRKNNCMSQEMLANRLKINRNNLSRIETGKSEPTLSIIRDIAKLFNVDVESLIGIDKSGMNKKEKIDVITKECENLLDNDLDLIIRLVSILREEYVKSDLENE